jgi:hypothetical protein
VLGFTFPSVVMPVLGFTIPLDCCSSTKIRSLVQSSHPHRPGALSRLSSISTLSIGPSSYSPSFHSLLFRLMESIFLFMCSPLMTSLDLLLMELARGSKSQLRIALRWAFIPLLPPITGLVGGGLPLLLSHNL